MVHVRGEEMEAAGKKRPDKILEFYVDVCLSFHKHTQTHRHSLSPLLRMLYRLLKSLKINEAFPGPAVTSFDISVLYNIISLLPGNVMARHRIHLWNKEANWQIRINQHSVDHMHSSSRRPFWAEGGKALPIFCRKETLTSTKTNNPLISPAIFSPQLFARAKACAATAIGHRRRASKQERKPSKSHKECPFSSPHRKEKKKIVAYVYNPVSLFSLSPCHCISFFFYISPLSRHASFSSIEEERRKKEQQKLSIYLDIDIFLYYYASPTLSTRARMPIPETPAPFLKATWWH